MAAWMVMFFGSLLSGYVLLRAGSSAWDASAGDWRLAIGGGALLAAAAVAVRRRTWLGPAAATGLGAIVVLWLSAAHSQAFAAGATPASHLEFGSWFTITGCLLTVVAVVAGASVRAWRSPWIARPGSLVIIWGCLAVIWLVVLSAFSLA
jgi:hypothetical protein